MLKEDILLGAIAGALIVCAGALYALFFGLSRLYRSSNLTSVAYASYALLVAATLLLTRALQLEGFWSVVILTMLIGYFAAPYAIWKLCIGTHGDRADEIDIASSDSSRRLDG